LKHPRKTRLLPARHVVCALLPEKSTVSHFICLAGRPRPFGYSVTGPLILVPGYIRHGALPSEFLTPILTPFAAFTHSSSSSPAHCPAVVHRYTTLFNRAYPHTTPPGHASTTLVLVPFRPVLFDFGHLVQATTQPSLTLDTLAQANCKLSGAARSIFDPSWNWALTIKQTTHPPTT
jgi:hypothetical protein